MGLAVRGARWRAPGAGPEPQLPTGCAAGPRAPPSPRRGPRAYGCAPGLSRRTPPGAAAPSGWRRARPAGGEERGPVGAARPSRLVVGAAPGAEPGPAEGPRGLAVAGPRGRPREGARGQGPRGASVCPEQTGRRASEHPGWTVRPPDVPRWSVRSGSRTGSACPTRGRRS